MEFVKEQWYHMSMYDWYFKFDKWEKLNEKLFFSEKIPGNGKHHKIKDYITNVQFFKSENTKLIDIKDIKHLLPKDYKFEQKTKYYFY